MYVYRRTEPELFTVDGRWIPESDHSTEESAAKRVHYLNGGKEEKES